MAKTYYKVLIFLKRRPGTTVEELRDYYENRHVPLCARYGASYSRYVRRYVTPMPNAVTGNDAELDFDVITELWYEDHTLFEKVLEYAGRGKLPPEVIADEERVFDRTRIRYASVIECESSGFDASNR
jgi:EthD domain